MMCSARSLGSASSSSSSRASSSGVAPRGRVPAMGRSSTRSSLLAHHHLRRGTDDQGVAEAQKEHVGRGVDGAQGAVDIEGIGVELAGEALGEDDLDDVAGADVLLAALHRRLEGAGGEVGVSAPAAPGLGRTMRGGCGARSLAISASIPS